MAGPIDYQKLLLQYADTGIFLNSEEDLVFIGEKNLLFLEALLEKEHEKCSKLYQDAAKRFAFFMGKTIHDIKRMACEFDAIGQGNLNACKKCEYNVSNCCALFPVNGAYGDHHWRRYYPNTVSGLSNCIIANGTPDILEACQAELESRKRSLHLPFLETLDYLRIVRQALREAEDKPIFARWRPYNWSHNNDEVLCFLTKRRPAEMEPVVIGKILCGKVSSVDALGNCTIVDVCGGFHNVRSHDAQIIRREEYEYFKEYPDYFKVWLRAASWVDPSDYYATVMSWSPWQS